MGGGRSKTARTTQAMDGQQQAYAPPCYPGMMVPQQPVAGYPTGMCLPPQQMPMLPPPPHMQLPPAQMLPQSNMGANLPQWQVSPGFVGSLPPMQMQPGGGGTLSQPPMDWQNQSLPSMCSQMPLQPQMPMQTHVPFQAQMPLSSQSMMQFPQQQQAFGSSWLQQQQQPTGLDQYSALSNMSGLGWGHSSFACNPQQMQQPVYGTAMTPMAQTPKTCSIDYGQFSGYAPQQQPAWQTLPMMQQLQQPKPTKVKVVNYPPQPRTNQTSPRQHHQHHQQQQQQQPQQQL
jgi:hypothetical protein